MSNRFMRGTLAALLTTTSAGAMMMAAPAMAQDGADADDRIVVTGSRIGQDAALNSNSPVTSLGIDDIVETGETDITSLLRETPALQSSLPSTFSAFNAADTEDSDLGIGLLDLRNLGIERTLVLQNGRRHVAGTAGQAAVDINTIPVSLLDRVEVLTGGASSIYGADAVSGVVNFILRDGSDFDGLEVRGQGGISDNGDAEEAFLSVATGFDFDDGRGSAVVGVEYTRTEAVFAGDRSFAGSGQRTFAPNNAAIAALVGADPAAVNTFVPDYRLPVSSRLGIISILNRNDGLNAAFEGFSLGLLGSDGSVPFTPLNGGGDSTVPMFQVLDGGSVRPYNAGTFIDLFNASGGDGIEAVPDDELILPETNRVLVNANAEYEITRGLNFFVETKFAYTDTFDSIQVNGFNDDIPIAFDNPFLPAEVSAQIATLQGLGADPILSVSRDALDTAIVPVPNAERNTFRIVGGFRGAILDDIVNYELSYNYGRTTINVVDDNTRIEDRYFAAIDAVALDAAGVMQVSDDDLSILGLRNGELVNITPDTAQVGDLVCRSSLDPTAEPPLSPFPQARSGFNTFDPGDGSPCVPINIFGRNTIDGPGAEFAFIRTLDHTVATQESILGTISGETIGLFELPAGPIGWAAGFEYRREKSDFTPDPLDTAGLTAGAVNAGPTRRSFGSISVWDFFVEGRVPVLRDFPLVDYLELTGSARFSDYNTIGRTTAWSIGGRWEVYEDVTFRGTFSKAVRAPNIGELFGPQNPATLGADQDPCNPQFINAGTSFRAANCAALGIPAGYNSTMFNTAFVAGLSGGNPDLGEESATTITAGVIWRPSFINGLTVIADFYDIKIDNAIDALGAFDIAQACVDLPSINNQFCDLIERDPTNRNIVGFTSGQINLGALETRGVDWQVSYAMDQVPFINFGDAFTLGAAGTRFLRFNEFQDPVDSSVFEDDLGTFTVPRWIINFTADLETGNWTWGWNGRFESTQLLPGVDNDDLISNPNFVDPFETGGAFVHDFTTSYQVNDNLNIYGGINNAFDRKPFIASLSRPAGPRGRFFFIGAQANF